MLCCFELLICADNNTVREKARVKTSSFCGPVHDKSVRKSSCILPPSRLFGMRNGIHLQPGGAMLVRRGNRPAADAIGRRRLPVPGLLAQERGGCFGRSRFAILSGAGDQGAHGKRLCTIRHTGKPSSRVSAQQFKLSEKIGVGIYSSVTFHGSEVSAPIDPLTRRG
jgi:hypothetical protein